jgi:hypothetical protein
VRPPRDGAPIDRYVRPQQRWQCGLSDEGPPCPLGPDGHGVCPAAAACHPTRDGDRWLCNRSPLRGGPCDGGPGPDGTCGVVLRCTPLRALRSRRGRFVAGFFVAAVGAACMALSGSWRNAIVAPGPLAIHHAHLVEGAATGKGCAQCHPRAGESSSAWLGVGETTATKVSQTSLCVACAACHREHRGRGHDLTAISDAACQACHREQYDSFAEGHPDFGLWPHERRTRIVFDHASHKQKYFPTENSEFACATCHAPDASGERQLTLGYEESCAACHDKGLAVSVAQGAPLVALPMLDLEALADAGHAVEPWPEEAAGDFDGKLPVATRVLLSAKPQAAEALVELGAEFDFFDIDPDDEEQLAAAAIVAAALRDLVDELAEGGQSALAERLAAVLGRDVTAAELDALAGGLAPNETGAYRDRWFSDSDAAGEKAAERVRGGWSRDDATLSLRYQPAGHADPWLRAWLDVLAEAATGPRADVAEPLLRAALAPTAPGQCGSCHSVERDNAGRITIQWRAFTGAGDGPGLTHFSHRSHVLQSQLRDCTACHEMTPAATSSASDNPRQFVAGCAPLRKAACVTCHTTAAAGAGCTLCHSYHGHQPLP